jgi:hypothetical protein
VSNNSAPTLSASKAEQESDMSKDSDRISDLNTLVTNYGANAKVAATDGPGRQQDLSDRALTMLKHNNEIRGLKGTVTNP